MCVCVGEKWANSAEPGSELGMGTGGRLFLGMYHVCEWEISRGGDVAFAAALGKILLVAAVGGSLRRCNWACLFASMQ